MIAGQFFYGITGVQFGGVDADYHVDSGDQITAFVPPGASPGPVTIVATPQNAVSTESFALDPGAIRGMTPSYGPSGALVSITGTGFSGIQDVRFNGISAASYRVDSEARIIATAPPDAVSGPVSVVTAAATLVSPFPFVVTSAGRPVGLQATPLGSTVALSWTRAPRAASYLVKRAATAGGPYASITAAGNAYLDTDVTPGTLYYYVVCGVGGDGAAGPASTEVSALPQDPASGLSAAAGDTQVTLSWNASRGAVFYRILQSGSSGGPYTEAATTSVPQYTAAGLENETPYYFVVSALDSQGYSSPHSAEVRTVPTASQLPPSLRLDLVLATNPMLVQTGYNYIPLRFPTEVAAGAYSSGTWHAAIQDHGTFGVYRGSPFFIGEAPFPLAGELGGGLQPPVLRRRLPLARDS